MARGKSTKLLAALPAQYSSDWLERFDKRTKIWRAIVTRIGTLESDAGGTDDLSHARRSIIRRAVFLELLTETQEMRFTAGETIDVGAYTQALNSLLGAYRLLGLERQAKRLPSIADYIESRADTDTSAPLADDLAPSPSGGAFSSTTETSV